MNYPTYYYPPQYIQPMYQQLPMQSQQSTQAQNQQSNQMQKPQVQNTGFIVVPTEDDAYRYPVAPGNCMTFKIENEPVVIEKSMSFSQLDNPRIVRYILKREDVIEQPQYIDTVEMSHAPADDGLKEELRGELQAIRQEIEGIRKKLEKPSNNNQPKKSEVTKHDE